MGSKDVDRLSNMPDEVLSEILSLMPTKLAVRTSILSKRWRYNWTLVTNIDIDVLPFHGVENCCTFVDRVLDLCKSNEIKLFRLRFSNLWVQESRMTKWINEALRRKVSEFEIQCGLLELPISFYTCKTLTKLRVENECQEVFMDWQTPFNLPCLKTLDIALFSKPSLNAYKLIRGCPILESLSLQFTYNPDEEEYIFSIPTLKRLTLIKMLKWRRCNKLVFIVPNLEELCLDSRWCTPLRRKVSEFEIQCGLLELPISFYTCKTLTKLRVENECQEVFMDWQTPFNLPCLKTLDIALFSKPSLNAYKLIRGCPILESLSLQFTYNPDEEEYIFSIPTLKRLTLIKMLKWRRCNKLVFIVPNLEELCLDSRWCTPFEMEELPSLVLELSDGPLRKVVNIKHLELKSDCYLCWVLIFQYLESCSQLEHLTIEKPRESDWIEPQTVPTCMLMNLKTIKFENCMGEKDDIQFLEYMLGNAEVLKRITITCKSGLMEEELRLCARLLKCPRASKYCEINFVGKSFDSATS